MSITGFHSVTLATPHPDATRAAYRTLFGPSADAESTTGAITVVPAETARAMAVRFVVDDLDASSKLLRRRGLGLSEDAAPAVTVNGVTLEITDESRIAPSDTDLVGLDHVVYTTSNPDRAVATLGARLGLDLRLDQTKFQGMRQLFFRCGSGFLELLVAPDPEAVPGTPTSGDDALWGVAWRSTDIDATHARLTAAGVPLSEVRDGRKKGTRVCTVRDRNLAVPTILIEQV